MRLPDKKPELVCPAGTPASLRVAVDAGADAVYCGFQNATNARNFPGLNFTLQELEESVAYAHARGAKVLLALNTFPPAGRTALWKQAAADGVRLGVDEIIVADIGVAHHIASAYPDQQLHLSVQAGAPSVEAIKYYCEEFGVKRVVLPRILSIPEIKELKKEILCEIETFIFGNQGLMAEGRCSLTNFVSGVSTNFDGVCSPPSDVKFYEDKNHMLYSQLGEFTIDCFSCSQGAGYPTICKGKYVAPHREDAYYAFEEPISLNLSDMCCHSLSPQALRHSRSKAVSAQRPMSSKWFQRGARRWIARCRDYRCRKPIWSHCPRDRKKQPVPSAASNGDNHEPATDAWPFAV